MTEDDNTRLRKCLDTVRNLEEENRHLRRAAASFGQLAERLNEELGRDRRVADRDRRREPRDTTERRNQAQPQ
jgi:predicted RNase H-like nuclease (RuvC/YqgF family)